MKLISVRVAVAGALLAAALSGCVVTARPVVPAVGVEVAAPGVEVIAPSAPPAPQVEVVGVAPAPGYFWIGGAWFWEGGRYAWHPGHWMAPRPGYRWEPHHWVYANGGWHMHAGHWVGRG
jgi:WXXGXW repeat (2 copies)